MEANARRERFVKLAEKRVVRAIRELRLVGNLANRSNYAYGKADVDKIMRVLDTEMKLLRQRFELGGKKEEISFKL
jgi:hypothetical protein